MNYSESLLEGLADQDIHFPLIDLQLEIELDNGIFFNNCFIVNEYENIMIIAVTRYDGREIIKVINKKNIVCIGVMYEMEQLPKKIIRGYQ